MVSLRKRPLPSTGQPSLLSAPWKQQRLAKASNSVSAGVATSDEDETEQALLPAADFISGGGETSMMVEVERIIRTAGKVQIVQRVRFAAPTEMLQRFLEHPFLAEEGGLSAGSEPMWLSAAMPGRSAS